MRLIASLAKLIAGVAVALALAVAVVWPWPAPDVAWRTPFEAAHARGDCASVTKILDGAVIAGSADAFRSRVAVADEGRCYKGEVVPRRDEWALYIAHKARRRSHLEMIALVYGLDENDLGLLGNATVMAILFVCGAPYNTTLGVDNAALAKEIGERPSFTLRLHQSRRDICSRILQHTAAGLVDAADHASRAVAYEILGQQPCVERLDSDLTYAKLVFVQGFPDGDATPLAKPTGAGRTARVIAWAD